MLTPTSTGLNALVASKTSISTRPLKTVSRVLREKLTTSSQVNVSVLRAPTGTTRPASSVSTRGTLTLTLKLAKVVPMVLSTTWNIRNVCVVPMRLRFTRMNDAKSALKTRNTTTPRIHARNVREGRSLTPHLDAANARTVLPSGMVQSARNVLKASPSALTKESASQKRDMNTIYLILRELPLLHHHCSEGSFPFPGF